MTTSSASRIVAVLAFLGSLVLLGGLAAGDYVTGSEYSFSIFYLMPIFICAHYSGKWPGMIMAFLCGVAVFGVDYQYRWNHGPAYSEEIVGYWNGMALLGFFLIFTLLVASLEESLEREKGINRNLESLLTLAPYDDRGWNLPFKSGGGGSSPAPQRQPVLPEDSGDEEIKHEEPKQSG